MALAFITGGTVGLGAETARQALARGWEVAVLDLSDDRLPEDLKGVQFFKGDVTREDTVTAALDAMGAVPDLLVNNAGIVTFMPLLECSKAEFERVIAINLTGAVSVSRLAAERMIPRGSGSIVNITSTGGICTSPGTHAYAAAKRGLAAMTELMAQEWGPLGLRINAVAPGMIDGGMSTGIYANEEAAERRRAAVPSRRLGTESDIAEAVMWLASDAASYVNGHELVVDGGVTKNMMSMIPR
ncbi:SDR family NAD(P)-dependent oxidoreductase [Maritimibacter sp. DP1N21-5]|uniref:SDR family NAD(P)-dependent oxidoreductase n=1 Tax=Maritimibacter sp. DP1N21-5 TaxID=2836867 RepID=UPI001C47DA80|nr:SDR family oxidoreductase [Maritimibacter sp. DP1N21-5]MBV7407460.1 SDR family oxidoreductase [Maritimibacter sp. DP1N21-5]